MPPATGSRSRTSTRLTPRRRSLVAAASPAGPPPTITTSWRSKSAMADGQWLGEVSRGHGGKLRAAVEPLAAAHARPGASLQSAQVAGGQRTSQRGLDLAPAHQLAVADDAAMSRNSPVPLEVLSQIRHARPCRIGGLIHAEAKKLGRVPGQAQGGGEAGRADPADCQPVAIGLVPDAVVL